MSTAAAAAPARTGTVLADLLPASRVRDIALVAGGAVLTGLAAQISLPVPGSPVPVSGQTFAALLVGTALGARRGFLSLALYALAGMAGMPWFAEGTAGYAMPTLGYILGMLLAATAVGALARRGADRSVLRMAGTMALGSLIIYAVGVPYLALATGMPLSRAVAVGLLPFLIGDALKAALAMGLLPTAWRLVGRRD
ncbi:biotin transporter BioY [Streptomyces kanasensis]|uniref:biotin transporter BioY n=1 Tax=Streptomyces kanasensis TaxID=936756 RepID=UPI0037012DAA